MKLKRPRRLKVCPECREAVPLTADYCPHCGRPLAEPTPLPYRTLADGLHLVGGIMIAIGILILATQVPAVWLILFGAALFFLARFV